MLKDLFPRHPRGWVCGGGCLRCVLGRESAGEADAGGVDARHLPKAHLRAPEAAVAEACAHGGRAVLAAAVDAGGRRARCVGSRGGAGGLAG